MSLCPEAAARAAMDEYQFGDHIARSLGVHPDIDPDPDDDPGDYDPRAGACAECGEVGGCAYDAEGRALIHTDRFGGDE